MYKLLLSILLFVLIPTISFTQSKKNKIPKSIRKSPELLAQYLTKNTSSEQQKVDSIYKWITNNIAYNYDVLDDTKPLNFQSPKDVLKTKKAVCSGYVYLMVDMLATIGVKSEYIEGYTRPYEMDSASTVFDSDHAWIAINIDDEWKLADPTWDAGYIGRIPKKNKVYPKRWLREKSFKWKKRTNYRSKRITKKKENFDKKQKERDPYTNKHGFVFKPSKNWYLIDVDSFLMYHLPTIPQWQLKDKYITVQQFCDKTENLPENLSKPNGENIEYKILNEEYLDKNLLDKWIYTAENGYKFNEDNFGVKAIHYHNFIGVLTDLDFKKSMSHLSLEHSMPIYETLYNMSDTVLIYAKAAMDMEKASFKSTQKDMALKFKSEENQDKSHLKSIEKIEKNMDKVDGLLSVALDRIEKEIETAKKKMEEVAEKYPNIEYEQPISEKDKLELAPLFKSSDSLIIKASNYYDNWRDLVDTTCLGRMYDVGYEADYFFRLNEQYLSFNSMNYTPDIQELDSLTLSEINRINFILMDSLVKEIPAKDPFSDLKAYEQLIKKYKPILKQKAIDKKIINASNVEFYLYSSYYKLLKKHMDYSFQSRKYCGFMSPELKKYNLILNKLQDDLSSNTKAKVKRKKQLNEELENGNKRGINLYTTISKNAKKWKSTFKAKLK